MTAVMLTSESGLTAVTVLMDEDTGIGQVRISTPNNPEQVISLKGEAPGMPDAEPRSEVIERLMDEAGLTEQEPVSEFETEASEPEPESEEEPVQPRARRTRK